MSGLLIAVTISIDRGLLLAKKPLYQGFLVVKLKSSLLMLYCRHHGLINRYGISVSQMATNIFRFL